MRLKSFVRLGLLFTMAILLLTTISVHATITVQDYWHMGEYDPNGTSGNRPMTAVDSVGAHNLVYGGGAAVYSASVSGDAGAHAGSFLAVNLTNSAFASNSIISTVVDNFGIEAWVNPREVTNSQMIVYNGNTGTSGWGIMINNSAYAAIYGGRTIFGTDVAAPGVWTHVALVRNNGTATFYVNGVAVGTSPSTPAVAVGNFAIGAAPQAGNGEFFDGSIDEVRTFTFTAGQFSLNDLLLNQASPFMPGVTNLLESSLGSTDSLFLAASSPSLPWTAVPNMNWLHFQFGNGVGPGGLVFTCDANPGAARTGTLTLAGQTITVTQAATNYLPVTAFTTLSSLNVKNNLTADSSGDIYFIDASGFIEEWNVTDQTATTLISSGLNNPQGLAVDGAGNLYIADSGNNAIKKWSVTTHALTTLVSSNLKSPSGVTVDIPGNVYISDTGNNAVKEWNVTNQTVSTLIPSGINAPDCIAVDVTGNLYISDDADSSTYTWRSATQSFNYISMGSAAPGRKGMAVDGEGDVFIDESVAVAEINFFIPQVTTFPIFDQLVSVDGQRNIYLASTGSGVVAELPCAFFDAATQWVGNLAGSSSLPPVLPVTANLSGAFYPSTDQPWLTITGVTNGIVSYAFTGNTSTANRTAHILLFGQPVPITQVGVPTLATTNLVEGPAGGADSVLLDVTLPTNSWVASANAPWLHLNTDNGASSTNIGFIFDANSGATRTGILTIAGQALTVTQAGTNYIAATNQIVLANGFNFLEASAVDNAGNVYVVDPGVNAIAEWNVTNQTVTTLVSSGLNNPLSLAVDSAGNVYIADTDNNAVKEWNVRNQTLNTLVSFPETNYPYGVAVDKAGNVYISDAGANAVEEWNVANQTLTPLISNLKGGTMSVTVDSLGNVYSADTYNDPIVEWNPANQTVTSLPGAQQQGGGPDVFAVDNGGNLYLSSGRNGEIWQWNAASQAETVVVNAATNLYGQSVDAARNIYSVTIGGGLLMEQPHAFLDGTTQSLDGSAGTGILSPVLPTTANLTGVFYPTSDQPWLSIIGTASGQVSYAYTANVTGSNRTAHISLLGMPVTVTQASVLITSPVLTGINLLANGDLQFSFTNNPAAGFTILASTNLTLPLNQWSVIGTATNVTGNVFQFATPRNFNGPQMFYRVRSP